MSDFKYEGRVYSQANANSLSRTFYVVDDAGTVFVKITDGQFLNDEQRFNIYDEKQAMPATLGELLKQRTRKKPNIVEVIRHVRGYDYENLCVSSRGGMTALCLLNYETGLMTVHPAFCSEEDNYNKREGIYWARKAQHNNQGFTVPFDELNAWNTIVETIMSQDPVWLNAYSESKFERHLNRIKGAA